MRMMRLTQVLGFLLKQESVTRKEERKTSLILRPFPRAIPTDLDKEHVTTCEDGGRQDAHGQLAIVAPPKVLGQVGGLKGTLAREVIECRLVPHLGVLQGFDPLVWEMHEEQGRHE